MPDKDFSLVFDWAKKVMRQETFGTFLENNPEHHAPIYHELGLVGHMFAAHQAALMIRERTGLDSVNAALVHDLGKLKNFEQAVIQDGTGSAFRGHEYVSAEIAEYLGLSQEECLAVRYHGLVHDTSVSSAQIASLLGSEQATKLWCGLCASDTVAKGWSLFQTKQRTDVISKRIQELGKLPGFGEVLSELVWDVNFSPIPNLEGMASFGVMPPVCKTFLLTYTSDGLMDLSECTTDPFSENMVISGSLEYVLRSLGRYMGKSKNGVGMLPPYTLLNEKISGGETEIQYESCESGDEWLSGSYTIELRAMEECGASDILLREWERIREKIRPMFSISKWAM